ncbi:MAG: hypothetical protein ACE366_02010 [Bradymonadia bacterium]
MDRPEGVGTDPLALTDAVQPGADLLTWDGHLTDLTIERVLCADLNAQEQAVVRTHVQRCDDCAADLQAIAEDEGLSDASLVSLLGEADTASTAKASAPPATTQGKILAFPTVVLSSLALAAAAALVLWITPGGQPTTGQPIDPSLSDHIVLKGTDFEWEVHIHDGSSAQRARHNQHVRPGDRVGFKVLSRKGGHLAILGVDASGATYVGYPQGKARSAPLSAAKALSDLPDALRFDSAGDHERLVALLCPAPFSLEEAQRRLGERAHTTSDAPTPLIWRQCDQKELRLRKGSTPQ